MGRHALASRRLYIEGELVRERDVGDRSRAALRSFLRADSVTDSSPFYESPRI